MYLSYCYLYFPLFYPETTPDYKSDIKNVAISEYSLSTLRSNLFQVFDGKFDT